VALELAWDFADPTTALDPAHPDSPPPGSARGVYMTSNGGPNGIMSVSASGNSFVNERNDPTYEYGFYFQDTVFFPSVGENWYYQLKRTNLAIDRPSAAMVVSLPPVPTKYLI
jgi:hypothetical protein